MRARSAVLLVLVLATAPVRAAVAGELAVIVHAERDVQLSVAEVAQIYLKKRRFWEGTRAIVPVNRDSGSAIRRAFVRQIFGNLASTLVVYWNRQYFKGVLPPATLASNEAVRRFVASEERAIGYVDASAVDASVRVVLRLHDPSYEASPVPAPAAP